MAMAIAKNFRKFPEALLYQLELALVDVRGVVPVPEWVKVAKRKAAALARMVKAAVLDLWSSK